LSEQPEDHRLSGFDLERINIIHTPLSIGTGSEELVAPKQRTLCAPVCSICYHLLGEGNYQNTVTKTSFPFGPGTLRLFHPRDEYFKKSQPGAHADKFLSLPEGYYTLLSDMQLVDRQRPVIQLGLHRSIANGFDQLILAAQQTRESSLPRLLVQSFSFIVELLLPRPAVPIERRRILEAAAHCLEADTTEQVTIPELARTHNMSCTNFRRDFTRFFGCSPVTYRIKKKIERIQQILLSESRPLKDVAHRFGYPDIYALSRQFKKYTGRTPSQFRKNGF
jgi:AraC-like DNA-binding protein